MEKYLVVWCDELRLDSIEYFMCDADDTDHAIEQCQDAYPEGTVYTVYLLNDDAVVWELNRESENI